MAAAFEQDLAEQGLAPPPGNLLLHALPASEARAAAELAERVALDYGMQLNSGRNPAVHELWFPETAILAVFDDPEDLTLEIALIGGEGMIGWPVLLNGTASAVSTLVRQPGTALRVDPANVAAMAARCPGLRTILVRYVQSLTVQMASTIGSTLRDCVRARLARRLLMLHDRTAGDMLLTTHSQLATGLNIRRASVTDELHVLEGERILRCRRGHIEIRDRATLEAAAARYGLAEASYRTLIGPFGKPAA